MQELQMEVGHRKMKLSKIAQLCKKYPHVSVFSTAQTQWISVGAAAYAAYGLPPITGSEQLATVMDIPEEKRDAFKVDFIEPDNLGMFDDYDREEHTLREVNYSFMQRGSMLMPLFTADGNVYWINECYLKPVEDEEGLTYWLREMWDGMYAVAVKSGYVIRAVIGVRIASLDTDEAMREVLRGTAQSRSKGYRIPPEAVEKFHGYQLPVTGFSEASIERIRRECAEQERLV